MIIVMDISCDTSGTGGVTSLHWLTFLMLLLCFRFRWARFDSCARTTHHIRPLEIQFSAVFMIIYRAY